MYAIKVIDESGAEVESVDYERGYVVKEETDGEEFMRYVLYTAEELAGIEAKREEEERLYIEQQEHKEIIDSLPDAIAELSEMVSDNAVNMVDVMDAIADLSEIVSNLMEGE